MRRRCEPEMAQRSASGRRRPLWLISGGVYFLRDQEGA
jgi:hypothetical protein